MLESSQPRRSQPDLAVRPLVALGLVVAGVLAAGSTGYGYHRDELYFLVCAGHLSWGYVDQGPLTPFVAYVMHGIAPGSLALLRLPSAVMTGLVVVTAGALNYELGGARRAQLIAAGCMAVSVDALFTGHLQSTSTFDLLAWGVVTWLVARSVRTGDTRLWAIAGIVAGFGLLDKPLIAFLLVALALGLAACGPRELLRNGWVWLGIVLALAIWSPWLVWQAHHGWPQLDVASSIANGDSGSSQPRWALLPFQLLLISPVLAPVWIAGLVSLLRRPSLRRFRFFGATWIALALMFLVTGGKPYYLAGMFPVLLGAGAIDVDAWLDRGARRRRRIELGVAFALSAAVALVIALPVLPARDAGPVIALNGDVGETIGWPDLVRSVARVYRSAPGAVIFTSNYGEAGAIDRYGPALGLPAAYSGHNSFAEWGPPPDRPGPVVVVGLDGMDLMSDFRGCRLAASVANAAGAKNDERGAPIERCSGTRRPWSQLWRGLRHYD